MKNLLVYVCVLGVSAILLGCTPKRQGTNVQPNNADVAFEENHDDEMKRKEAEVAEREQQGEKYIESASQTVQLLMPDNKRKIISESITYFEDVQGYISYPEDTMNAPGVIVIHERRGLNENIKDMTKVLAANGYAALAVDLYNGQVAQSSDEASEMMGSVDSDEAIQNLLAAEKLLRDGYQAEHVASLGRCFGGAQSLNLSLASSTLDATAIYYGRLQTDPEVLREIRQPVLGIFAEDDSGIPPEVVVEFQDALGEVGVEYDVTIYPGVDHAFANPTGGNFNKEATVSAREKTLSFLAENLPQPTTDLNEGEVVIPDEETLGEGAVDTEE